MNAQLRFRTSAVVALGCIALLGTGACSGNDKAKGDQAGIDTAPSATTSAPTSSSEPSPGADKISSFRDTFEDDSNGWALPPGPQGTMTMTGGDFVWDMKLPLLRPHVSAATLGDAYDAGRIDMTNVAVTASVTPKRGAAAFGVFCREVPDPGSDFQWYEFVVRDGYAAIRHADSSGKLDPLAEGEADVPLGDPVTLEATCVDQSDGSAALTLSVAGDQLLTAQVRDPLGNGVAGLQAYDAPAQQSTDRMLLAWHDFAVEPAP